ncbi:MAG: ATP-binding protein [Methylophaga sp.]|nr:ATP-binding protein [Methylophaga sp.]
MNAPPKSIYRYLQCLPVGEESPHLAALLAGGLTPRSDLKADDDVADQFEDLTELQKTALFTAGMQKLLPELGQQALQHVLFKKLLQWQPVAADQSNGCAELSLIEARCQPEQGAELILLFLLIQPNPAAENTSPSVFYLQTESVDKVFPALYSDVFGSLRDLLDQQDLNLQQLIPITAWELCLSLKAGHIHYFDIREFSKTLISQLAMPEASGQRLYMVLIELFSNALEHGILELDPVLKEDPAGFLEYYRQREQRIDTLTDGSIQLTINYIRTGQQNNLNIIVTDSGKGFDYNQQLPTFSGKQRSSGRGTALVKALCNDIHFYGDGNCVNVNFEW